MSLPDFETLFLKTPLYETFPFTENDAEYIYELIHFHNTIDGFCPTCNKQSTYGGMQILPSGFEGPLKTYAEYRRFGNISNFKNKIYHLNFACTRNENHQMQICIYITDSTLFKIGQYPSIADLSLPELKKYREVLSSEKYKEFSRGIGLITHGVGVGSYVYLRRIFEDLIEEAHAIDKSNDGWNEEKYQRARMDEKIELLKNLLPSFLVENRQLYGVLSKGIHELTENECLDYFPTVKLAIELILDEKLEQKRRNDKIYEAQKSLNKIHASLKAQ